MKKADHRKIYITSLLRNIQEILKPLLGQSNLTYSQLSKACKLRGGSFTSALTDAEILKTIHRTENMIQITELGKHLLHKPNKEQIKEAGLNVPIFKEYLDIKNQTPNLFNWGGSPEIFFKEKFKKYYTDHSLNRVVNQATARYIEFIEGQNSKEDSIKLVQNNRPTFKEFFRALDFSEEELSKIAEFLIINENSPLSKDSKARLLNEYGK